MLQREAGYIDARPSPTRSTKKSLATHGRTIHSGHAQANCNGLASVKALPLGTSLCQEETFRAGPLAGTKGLNITPRCSSRKP